MARGNSSILLADNLPEAAPSKDALFCKDSLAIKGRQIMRLISFTHQEAAVATIYFNYDHYHLNNYALSHGKKRGFGLRKFHCDSQYAE